MDQLSVEVPWEVLLGTGGRKPQPAHIFVAYRFNNADSKALRAGLKEAIRLEPELRDDDGHVEEGDAWAPTVRKRIRKSRLVVADLTGPSREVLFEVGFAGNKVIFPLCHQETDLESLPACLTMRQMSTFKGEQLPIVVDKIIDRALGPVATFRRPSPVPGQIVWIQGQDSAWADEARHKVEDLARETSLPFSRVDPDELYSFEDLEEHMRCWLFVGCIDGSRSDHASHLFFGDVAARTKAGAGSGKGEYVNRHAIAFAQSKDLAEKFLADGAKRLTKQILTIACDGGVMVSEADKHLKRYVAWRTRKL